MATVYMLSDSWYHGFINSVEDRLHPDLSPDAHANAIALLNAAAMVANSIDNAFRQDRERRSVPMNVPDSIEELASNVSTLSEAIKALMNKNPERE